MSKIIRNVKLSDAPQIAKIYKHYVDNTAISFEQEAPLTKDMEQRIDKTTKIFPWIVMEIDSEIVGYAYASKFRERIAYRYTTEISVYLSQEHCGKGYGRELAKLLIAEIKKCGFYIAIACITATNSNSTLFFESLGFVTCAEYKNSGFKNGEWLSVIMMTMDLQDEFPAIPEETICDAHEYIY